MLKVIVWLLIFTPLYVVLLRITHGVEFIVVLTMPVILAALGFSMWRLNRSDRDLGDTGASLPSKGWAGKNLKVKYADVEKIEISLPDTDRGPATGAIHIKSRTPHGTVATEVSSTEFESEAAMRSYAEALMRKVKASQPGRVVTSRPRPGGWGSSDAKRIRRIEIRCAGYLSTRPKRTRAKRRNPLRIVHARAWRGGRPVLR